MFLRFFGVAQRPKQAEGECQTSSQSKKIALKWKCPAGMKTVVLAMKYHVALAFFCFAEVQLRHDRQICLRRSGLERDRDTPKVSCLSLGGRGREDGVKARAAPCR